MDKISIIVTVYNVENYLRRCINSIIHQTYQNLEIILIDDGSTDCSSEICDEYEKVDSRIRVIHKENEGISSARNEGLKIVSGDYIGFVDSDDMIREDMYEILMENILRTDADFIKSDFQQFFDEKELKYEKTNYKVSIYSPDEAIRDFIETEYSNKKPMKSTIWDGLYKKTVFFKDGELVCTFPKGKINEDTYIFPRLIYNASKIAHIDEELYFYFQRPGSIMNSDISIPEIKSYDLWKQIDKEISSHTTVYKRKCAFNSATRCISLLNQIYNSTYKEEYFYLVQQFILDEKKYFYQNISDKKLRRTIRVIKYYYIYRIIKRIFPQYFF